MVWGVLFVAASGCDDQDPSASLAPAQAQLLNRGRAVYTTNCIACHHSNPALDGSIGPAVKNSSLELLRARILTKSYPPGYQPKRKTEIMPTFTHLENDLEALHFFLNH